MTFNCAIKIFIHSFHSFKKNLDYSFKNSFKIIHSNHIFILKKVEHDSFKKLVDYLISVLGHFTLLGGTSSILLLSITYF